MKKSESIKRRTRKSSLIFVVQQHFASHLHYDFRLEMDGVLKSWTIPKGPSMNPTDKRLAIMVEDHPFDYKDFEGKIPEGNYGAGNVLIWDKGTYHSIRNKDIYQSEKELLTGLKEGEIKFILKGKKLKGEFLLIKTRARKQNSWLLIKKQDKFAKHEETMGNSSTINNRKSLMQDKKVLNSKAD